MQQLKNFCAQIPQQYADSISYLFYSVQDHVGAPFYNSKNLAYHQNILLNIINNAPHVNIDQPVYFVSTGPYDSEKFILASPTKPNVKKGRVYEITFNHNSCNYLPLQYFFDNTTDFILFPPGRFFNQVPQQKNDYVFIPCKYQMSTIIISNVINFSLESRVDNVIDLLLSERNLLTSSMTSIDTIVDTILSKIFPFEKHNEPLKQLLKTKLFSQYEIIADNTRQKMKVYEDYVKTFNSQQISAIQEWKSENFGYIKCGADQDDSECRDIIQTIENCIENAPHVTSELTVYRGSESVANEYFGFFSTSLSLMTAARFTAKLCCIYAIKLLPGAYGILPLYVIDNEPLSSEQEVLLPSGRLWIQNEEKIKNKLVINCVFIPDSAQILNLQINDESWETRIDKYSDYINSILDENKTKFPNNLLREVIKRIIGDDADAQLIEHLAKKFELKNSKYFG